MPWLLRLIFFAAKSLQTPYVPSVRWSRETTGHVLWGCPVAKAVWSTCGGRIQKLCIEHVDFVVIFEIFIVIWKRKIWN
jgi:hypothetical protein